MRISILGPVEVEQDGRAIPISGARVRALLVRLAAGYGRVVPTPELLASIWDEDPPAEATNALQTLVSRLRRAIGLDGCVQQAPGGYRLDIAPEDVDAYRFTTASAQGRLLLREHRFEEAAELLSAAVALWRGEPLADLDPAPPLASELGELRLGALEDRIEAQLHTASASDVVAELEALLSAYPLRERLTALLLQALAAGGRTAEALTVYDRHRRWLADSLGSDPSAELQAVHLSLLRDSAGVPDRARHRTNLRAERTSFIGRTDETKRIDTLLDSGRLVSVVGPGGSGKTRLVSVLAGQRLGTFEDGVWFVELAPVSDTAEIAQAVLSSLGFRMNTVLDRNAERIPTNPTERLFDLLSDASCLLVIDNCEHLIAGVADLVDQLIARCPRLRILTTTREPLGIDGEALCILPPLGLPPKDVGPDDALEWPSVRLFADRATAVSADFVIDSATVDSVSTIVRRLDGLPLAIELAAARLRVMPVAEIAARLSDRFRLLTGGSRTAMPRHRTLRAVVEWSWELLSEQEQRLVERLSIFPSGATVASATAVCGDDELASDCIAELLNQLADKSLLQVTGETGVRYRMLETIREFGIGKLTQNQTIGWVRNAHARYFAALVHEADQWLRRAEQLPWLRALEAERDNILATLRFLGESGAADATIDLVVPLGLYWTLVGRHDEAAEWLQFALAVKGESDARRRTIAEALAALNVHAASMSGSEQDPKAIDDGALERVAGRLAELDDGKDPFVTVLRPIVEFLGDNPERMNEMFDHAVNIEDGWTRATIIAFRANVHENAGDIERMRADTMTALELFSELGERWGMAATLSSLGALQTVDGDLTAAIDSYERAIGHLAEFGANSDIAFLRVRLSSLYLRLGSFTEARRQAELVRSSELNSGSRMQRLMADLMESSVARATEDTAAIRRYQRSLASQLKALGPVHPRHGHLAAMALAVLAGLALSVDEVDAAGDLLCEAYPIALETRDMPVIAIIAVVAAGYAAYLGDAIAAARMLGAADQIRGAPDPTDPDVVRLIAQLNDQLGPDCQRHYRAGSGLSRADALAEVDPTPLRR